MVLSRLAEHKLFVKLEKCEFDQPSVTFLGFVVGTDGIRMDEQKVSVIKNWPIPKNVKEVQSFIGFCQFYRKFIPQFSAIVKPLTTLLKKNVTFVWGTKEQHAFLHLIERLTRKPVLLHADSAKKFIVETDASGYAIGGVLLQEGTDDQLHPIGYYSRSLNAAEMNYDIHDRELSAVVESFKHWRPHLAATQHTIEVLCDHKNLEYFMSTKLLNRRQARCSLHLADYDFKIV